MTDRAREHLSKIYEALSRYPDSSDPFMLLRMIREARGIVAAALASSEQGTDSAYPRPCGICAGVIQSEADLDWHGYGNCREIPEPILSSVVRDLSESLQAMLDISPFSRDAMDASIKVKDRAALERVALAGTESAEGPQDESANRVEMNYSLSRKKVIQRAASIPAETPKKGDEHDEE